MPIGKLIRYLWPRRLPVGTLAVVMNFVIPTYTVALQNRISALNDELKAVRNKLAETEVKVAASKEQGISLEKRLKETGQKVTELQLGAIFALGNPYPIGLGQVKVGDPIASLEKVYSTNITTREEGYWSIKDDHALFESITYYFDDREKKIYQIYFWVRRHLRSDYEGILQAKLVEGLGWPTANPRDKHFYWKTSAKVGVYKSGDGSFGILGENAVPNRWPK